MCRRYLPGCRRCRSVVQSIDLLPAFLGRLWPTGTGTLAFQEAPDGQQHRVPLRDGLPLAYDVQAAVPTADGPVFRWLPDGADETEWQPAGPSEAVRRLMDAYHVSQPTAMLAFL